ncbi:MAG: amino acid ABC transporter permease, partial [Cetobacterium sp.]
MRILKTIFFKPEKETENIFVKWFNIILVTIIVLGIFHFAFSSIDYPYNWRGIITKYRYKFILGFKMTLMISVFSSISSFIVGALLVLGQKGR